MTHRLKLMRATSTAIEKSRRFRVSFLRLRLPVMNSNEYSHIEIYRERNERFYVFGVSRGMERDAMKDDSQRLLVTKLGAKRNRPIFGETSFGRLTTKNGSVCTRHA